MPHVIAIILLVLLCSVFSSKSAAYLIEGFYEAGKRDTIEEMDEDDLDYSYDKYGLKIKKSITKPLTYTLSYSQEKRDYVTATLDNEYRQIKNKLEYLVEDKKEKRQLAVSFNYKTKDFKQADTSTYDRLIAKIRAAYKNKGSHLLRFTAGYDNFRFRSNPGKDEDIMTGKLEAEKYLGSLTLSGSSKIAHSNAALFGTQTVNKTGISYKPEWPYFDLMRFGYTFGYRNSRQEEGEFDNDYRFSQWNIYTRHPVGEKIRTVLKYKAVQKEYITGGYDHSGFELRNDWKISASKDLYTKLGLGYRQKIYKTVESLTHYRNGFELSLYYRKRQAWAWGLALRSIYYRFPHAAAKDRNDKRIELSLEKHIFEDLKLEFKYRYQIKDHYRASDVYQGLWRMGMKARLP